jgi:hypothetical protein
MTGKPRLIIVKPIPRKFSPEAIAKAFGAKMIPKGSEEEQRLHRLTPPYHREGRSDVSK